jgi:hypothetical protein
MKSHCAVFVAMKYTVVIGMLQWVSSTCIHVDYMMNIQERRGHS